MGKTGPARAGKPAAFRLRAPVRSTAFRRFKPAKAGTTSRLHLEPLEDRTLLNGGPLIDFSALAIDRDHYQADRILVHFHSEFANAGFQTLLGGATSASPLSLVSGLYEMTLAPGVSVQDALSAYRVDARVLYAEPNYRVQLQGAVSTNDARFGSMWNLNNVGQTGGRPDADIDAPEAWGITTGSGRVIVAVIDTGVDFRHPDLAPNMWVNPREIPGNGRDDDGNGYVDDIYGWDFANNDNNPWDDNGHGTHVAGTIGAVGNNGIGVVGVIWNVRIMALKFLDANGNGYTSDAIRALNYAVANGATISNNSWGGGGHDQALANAIANARNAGHIFVAAAGNNGANNDSVPYYPANYALDNVVAVAASDMHDNLASFSNYGRTTVDLAAPGVSIWSTTPNNTYAPWSGTSMATPHVTGVLALVRDLRPNWTYRQVIDQVLRSVDPVTSLQTRVATGGRLNAANAVSTLGPVVDYSGFLSRLYLDVLHRPADAAGLAAWVPLLQRGVPREAVARAVWESPEHRGMQVNQYYVTFLGRVPDYAGGAGWINAFLAGYREVDVMLGILASAEYRSRCGGAVGFVTHLYESLLGRSCSAAEMSAWVSALSTGTSYAAVAHGFLRSAEHNWRVIDSYFSAFLGRHLGPGEEQPWINALAAGQLSVKNIAGIILGSDEYFARVA